MPIKCKTVLLGCAVLSYTSGLLKNPLGAQCKWLIYFQSAFLSFGLVAYNQLNFQPMISGQQKTADW